MNLLLHMILFDNNMWYSMLRMWVIYYLLFKSDLISLFDYGEGRKHSRIIKRTIYIILILIE